MKHRKITNTQLAELNAHTIIQSGADLLSDMRSGGTAWHERTIALWRALISALCYKRDEQGANMSFETIAHYVALGQIEELYLEGYDEAKGRADKTWPRDYLGIKAYLEAGCPGYRVDRLLAMRDGIIDANRSDSSESRSRDITFEQDDIAHEQHGYRATLIGQMLAVLEDRGDTQRDSSVGRENPELTSVDAVRVPAIEGGATDEISITADIAGGGAINAVIPANELNNGYSLSIEPGYEQRGGATPYDIILASRQPWTAFRVKAPSREVAIEVQRELFDRITAVLRPAPPAPQPIPTADSGAPAELVHRPTRLNRRKRLFVGSVVAVGVATALVFAMGHRGDRSKQTTPVVPKDIAQTGGAMASPGFPQPLAQLMPIELQPIAPSGPEKDMDVTGNQLSELDIGNLKKMGEKVGIQLREGEVPFYVLADPACAACRALEPIWTQVPAKYKPIVIPVGFQNGGEALATAIQCSKDPLAAWKKTLAGDESLATNVNVCKEGATKVSAGNLFFHYLRLTGTPTIIAPNGVIAAGGDTAETLTAFLTQNEVAK